MLRKLNYIRNVFCGALSVLVFAVAVSGQSSLQNDLNSSFKKYDLIKSNKQKTSLQVETGQSLSIEISDGKLELNLTPNDLRAADYRAENTSVNGLETLEKGEVTTFKGKVAGKTDSEVRLTINGALIEGYIELKGERLFVEPAQNYSRFAAAEDLVVYRTEDLLKSDGFDCGSELGERIKQGKEMVAGYGVQTIQEQRVLELATEADYQYVTKFANAGRANSEILSTLNIVEGMYAKELNLSISITYQHSWTTQDPFDGTTINTTLTSFRDYWNLNFPQAQYPRSETHLFSAKPNIIGMGLAFVGVVCRDPNNAYSVNGVTINDGVNAAINSIVVAHEIGHTLGARHVDVVQNCANSAMNPVISYLTPATFCSYSSSEIANYITASASCLKVKTVATTPTPTPTPTPTATPIATPIPNPFPGPILIGNRTKFDFDGDGKADTAVWRQSNGVWYITNSGNSSFTFVQFGAPGDRMVPADYDGDGKADIAVYRAGTWFRLKSATNTFDSVGFGIAGDTPVAADFDGDGKSDTAVFRSSAGVWHRLLSGSGNAYSAVAFGSNGDVPLPADYDGDGKSDVNVWRPSNGVWYRLNSSNGAFFAAQFGAAGDKPVMGDFDGDGRADLVVWRPSNGVWYQLTAIGAFSSAGFGTMGDIPTAADYDGDGKTDVSVFRPSNGYWYRLNSSTGAFASAQFGAAGDIPIPAFYNQ